MRSCNSFGTNQYRPQATLSGLAIGLALMATALTATASISPALAATAHAAPCPRPETLGTSRVLEVDVSTTPRVGLQSFPETLPLADHEVVLTFDDGPWPPTTSRVLSALAQQCVRATYFLIGEHVSEHPGIVRRIVAEGHTVATHTWSHPNLMQIKHEEAIEQIDHGVSALETVLHGTASTTPTTPFFRFPGFQSTPETLDLLQSRGIVVFGSDLWASDWNKMTPKQELKLITDRLEAAGKGIILFHDTKNHTAAMMPAFLRYLRDNGYHVVHVKPAEPGASVTH
jgi:peptidoglycan/xylan/chitin deacetylase (PgdA/CDA1 family)